MKASEQRDAVAAVATPLRAELRMDCTDGVSSPVAEEQETIPVPGFNLCYTHVFVQGFCFTYSMVCVFCSMGFLILVSRLNFWRSPRLHVSLLMVLRIHQVMLQWKALM